MKTESADAIVVGATIRGLVATYLLDSLGLRSILLDRAPNAGGSDGSFETEDGSIFEYGMHVLDHMRSPLVSRLFTRVVEGRVHRTRLNRAIVLRGVTMPYSPAPEAMPAELRALLRDGELTDDLGDELPSRRRLSEIYGEGFADLVFDEVLPSFPAESRHLGFGVEEARLMTNIYPWFFPKATRIGGTRNSSRAFHDRLRAGIPQYVLYPEEGGFGGFSAGFMRQLDAERTEVLLGAKDLEIHFEPDRRRIESVTAGGRRFEARHYLWGASWPALCELMGLPCQSVATDRIVLGSFRFDRPIACPYQEILVGDPRLLINRLYFPGAFRGLSEPRLQIEFAFPVAEESERGLDSREWCDRWVGDLRALGLLDEDHRVELFDFKTRQLHFNGFGMEGVPLEDADPALIDPESNVYPLTPSMANLNLNEHVPRTVAGVARLLAGAAPTVG